MADKHGLSFYGDGTIAALVRISLPALIAARDELLARDLIAHETRFTQVLSLPPRWPAPLLRARRRADATGRDLAPGHRVATGRRRKEPAMNVGLWAEIRRLAEIEKLSGRAISRRLHCSRHTRGRGARTGSASRAPGRAPRQPLGPVQGQDRRPAGQVSRTLGGAHPRGNCSRPRWLYRQRDSPFAAICGRSGPHAVASIRKSTTSRPRRCRSIGASAAASKSETRPARSRSSWPCSATAGLIYIEFTLSQRKAEFYRGLVHALKFFGGQSPCHHLRQLESGVINGSGRSPVSIPSSWRCVATSTCSRSPANGVIPNQKESSRRSVRYVKHNALAGRAMSSSALRTTSRSHPGGVTRSPMSGYMRQPENDR